MHPIKSRTLSTSVSTTRRMLSAHPQRGAFRAREKIIGNALSSPEIADTSDGSPCIIAGKTVETTDVGGLVQ